MTEVTADWAGPARFLPPHEPAVRPDGSRHWSGLTYAVAMGYRPLQLDLWAPAGSPAPLVVWVHGGGFMFGDRRILPETFRPDQVPDAFLAAGIAVASIDYRHALEAPFPAQLLDAKAAVRWLRRFGPHLGLSTERIGIVGESAGAHIAASVGLTAHRADLEPAHGVQGESSAVQVVVDWYGPADLATMPRRQPPPHIAAKLPPELLVAPEDHLTRGLTGDALADASPVTHVTPQAPPFLLVHGTADWLVPYEQSEVLHAALTAAGVPSTLVPVEGAQHIFDGHDDVDGLVQLTVDFVAEQLS
ncbi:Acetyl esterase/lipase [Klenkia soli]|uniref:Acetyl esterase/lipase n=1 Tax=Klenkia soli TaxID=1052260 RepID=A0A1H0L4M1_9ACTN|nr:alpha/beta hydrolase [Klenkia soli]SDO63025.1 Acetyl esterase/lipase [Klenkia soli]